jgi:hypothetical protein
VNLDTTNLASRIELTVDAYQFFLPFPAQGVVCFLQEAAVSGKARDRLPRVIKSRCRTWSVAGSKESTLAPANGARAARKGAAAAPNHPPIKKGP